MTPDIQEGRRLLAWFDSPAPASRGEFDEVVKGIVAILPALLDAHDERDRLRAENERLRARVGQFEEIELSLIDERDAAQDVIDNIYTTILGKSPEWSHLFGYEQALDELEEVVVDELTAWLIECAPPIGDTLYFCSDGDWCNNPHHAHKFLSVNEAETKRKSMYLNGERYRVSEHGFVTRAALEGKP